MADEGEMMENVQRDARPFRWLEDLRREVVYGVRTWSKTLGFTITATLTRALDISAVTVIYSLVRNVVADPGSPLFSIPRYTVAGLLYERQ